jgi:hypothetical protein
MTLWEDRRGPWWDEDEFKCHYLLCGARVVSSPLWSISSRDRPAHQPPLQRWGQRSENQIPLTGRKVEAKIARGAPRSPSAVHGDRDADLRAHALCIPTMAVPLSSAPGPRPTGSWARAHWAKGPATCCACGSSHSPPPLPPCRVWVRAIPTPPSTLACALTWVQSSDPACIRPPALPPESALRPYSRSGWGLRTRANEAPPGVDLELPRPPQAPWLP